MTPEMAKALRDPFPASAIGKLPKGGVQLDYVGHAATTDRLLMVDPEWTWEPVAFDEHGLPAFQGKNLWIRLTVCGVTRYGVGDGSSVKECIGDAIRNAAMRFGVALDLWSKEELEQSGHDDREPVPQPERQQQPRDPGAISPAQLGKIGALMGDLGIRDRDSALAYVAAVIGRAVTSRNELTKAEASSLIEALAAEVDKKNAAGEVQA